MRVPRTATLLAAALTIAGCGPSQHPVDWYVKHPNATAQKVKWCQDDSARMTKSDCQNAMEANAQLLVTGKQKDDDHPKWSLPDNLYEQGKQGTKKLKLDH